MPFTQTTVRALAASAVLVAAGGTVAGAAVLHAPILGFGRAEAASANAAPASATPGVPGVERKVRPRVVVKTRYADEIVHRPAASSYARPASAPSSAQEVWSSAPSETAPTTTSPTTASSPTTTMAPPVVTTTTAPTTWVDDDHGSEAVDGSETDSTTPGSGASSSVPADR